jgi:hypothetical protein
MTDKEIVQALRCCESGVPCTRCPVVSNKNCVNVMHKRAADLIERLTAENAALREKQRWILVTERLPEKQQRVIVRCKTVGTTVGWIMFGEWVTDLGPGCGEVTHWMPLPEAPEGGDKHE